MNTSPGNNKAELSASKPIPGGRLEIDLAAILENYSLLQRLNPNSEIGAVVKADAYGLGVSRIAPLLAGAGARHFFLAQLQEALTLKPLLPDDAVFYVMNGLSPGEEDVCAASGCVPVLNTLSQAKAWAAAARRDEKLPAALQFETGMSRFGLSPADIDAIMVGGAIRAGLDIKMVMSHLACADEPAHEANDDQAARFLKMAERFPGVPTSLSNSAPGLLGDRPCDVIRAGLALYGAEPLNDRTISLKPVVKLFGRVMQVKKLEPGAGVGYGLTYVAQSATRIATIGVGYADGWPRALGNRGAAYMGDVRLPAVGRISMDSFSIDISAAPEGALKEGDLVELIGPHQSVEQVAAAADTISYEILTRLGARLERVYAEV